MTAWRWRPGMRRPALVACIAALAIIVAWTAGLGWFAWTAIRTTDQPPRADGIVALTGGADRVETALRLLSAGRAERLLLTGIGGGAELSELAQRTGLDPAPLLPRVTMGRLATSTHGNAAETAAWVRQHGVRSLIVVTANYHMPRALLEIARAVPDVTLHPVRVQPRGAAGIADLLTGRMLRLVVSEYVKWLAVEAGLMRLETILEPANGVPGAPPAARPPGVPRA